MACDEHLADRIRKELHKKHVIFMEKKMMDGLTFMINNKMCVGIVKNDLMARIGKDAYDAALEKKGCKPMDFTGRPMKGYVFLEPEGIDLDSELEYWIDLSLAFNQSL